MIAGGTVVSAATSRPEGSGLNQKACVELAFATWVQ